MTCFQDRLTTLFKTRLRIRDATTKRNINHWSNVYDSMTFAAEISLVNLSLNLITMHFIIA